MSAEPDWAERAREIVAFTGQTILVDADDYDLVSKYKWHVTIRKTNNYARATIAGKTVRMHRLIMNPRDDEYIDHINGNSLDNRKVNLRVCTHQQNMMNMKRVNNLSGFKGVLHRPHCKDRQWSAQIMFNQKHIYLGAFETAEAAAEAYDQAAVILFREFAALNFPQRNSSALLLDLARAAYASGRRSGLEESAQEVEAHFNGNHLGVSVSKRIRALAGRPPREPDPRDQRIAELERLLDSTQKQSDGRFDALNEAENDRDRLQAELDGLRKDYAKVRELSAKRGVQLQQARRTLEVVSYADRTYRYPPAEQWNEIARLTREALAATASPGDTDSAETVSLGSTDAPDPTALRLARAVALLKTAYGYVTAHRSEGQTKAHIADMDAFLAEPPTAAEREYAALLRVAEAAEHAEHVSRFKECARETGEALDALERALAELRQARSNGGSDG